MTLAELLAKRAEIADKIDASLKSESLSADDRKAVTDLETEFETLSGEIKAAEKLAADDAEARKRSAERLAALNAGRGRKTQPDPLPGATTAEKLSAVREVPPEEFKSLGEQLQAIAGAAINGRPDNRLKWESLTAASGGAQATVPSDGGYLIQKDFSADIVTRMNDVGQLKGKVRTVPIGPNSDGLKIFAVDETSRATGSRWGGVQVYWGAEADLATNKKPKFRMMELELKDLIGLAYVTNRLLQDATAIESVFTQAFSEEMSFMIEDGLINGTGAGMPLGILNCPALVSVAKETSQAAATIVFENIQKMWMRMWGRSRANSVWLINQDCEPSLNAMSLQVGTGGLPVYLPPGGLSQSPYSTLMGRPVVPVEYCATLGTVGDIILVDFSQILGIEKGAMQADSSIHVRFTTNENTFRFIYRYDAQPIWNSALMPYKGTNTRSPYVALASR